MERISHAVRDRAEEAVDRLPAAGDLALQLQYPGTAFRSSLKCGRIFYKDGKLPYPNLLILPVILMNPAASAVCHCGITIKFQLIMLNSRAIDLFPAPASHRGCGQRLKRNRILTSVSF
jgi:hypothetical protein